MIDKIYAEDDENWFVNATGGIEWINSISRDEEKEAHGEKKKKEKKGQRRQKLGGI